MDHQVVAARKPQGRRELDLGRHAQKIGRRIEDEGQAASQHFYEWERADRMMRTPPPCQVCGGSGCEACHGSGNAPSNGAGDGLAQREASMLRARWLKAQVRLDSVLAEIGWLLDQAQSELRPLDKHRTPAQVEADGWCGNCWAKAGALVPITLRPTGEPWYRGRCRPCGQWPGGDPPREVVEARNSKGKDPKVRAS